MYYLQSLKQIRGGIGKTKVLDSKFISAARDTRHIYDSIKEK